ncbi:alpha/beta hydrolase [Pseudonocardia sp.]|uniref:alpha/beta hydrolase n=1 Tax=Pseudonocardia sp. TaxID=60912 RepID=UPI003D0ED630
MIVDGCLQGAGGVELFWQGWLPEGEPTAILLVAHGLGEHSGRYRTVVDTLLPDGWAVYGLDHRGHGRSGGPRAHIEDYDHWLADFDTFRKAVVARHPGLPVFLLGHSMGGQIALAYALDHQDDLAGLVLSAPALANTSVPRPLQQVLKGVARVAPTLRPKVLDLDKISKDPEIVAGYHADPYVFHGNATLGLAAALLRRFEDLPDRARELRLPVLIMHGTEDALTDPAGSRRLEATCGSPDRTVRYYDGLWHEIFHEPERERPLGDLRGWLAAHR